MTGRVMILTEPSEEAIERVARVLCASRGYPTTAYSIAFLDMARVAYDAVVASGEAVSGVVVPEEPTETMLDAGQHANSEWLNDRAPLGERSYRDPARAVWTAMIAARPDPAPEREG